ncbi:hypothetical protein FXO38_35633 [Capsicum annuum]|nr:hypothetical protein FXO38_35633 [Capsicum annuum]
MEFARKNRQPLISPSATVSVDMVLVQKDARLLRDLRVMAFFRQCFPSDMKIAKIKELSRALAAHPPYEILISSIKIKHLHCEVGSAMVNDLL